MARTDMTRARATALLLGGVALGTARVRAADAPAARIRIALLPIEGAAQPYLAVDQGFFARAGIDADLQPMQGSSAIVAAVVSGAVDVGFVTVDVVASAHQRHIPIVVIAPAGEYTSAGTQNTEALVLPAASTVRVARDLNGKTIAATALHSLQVTAVRAWMDHHGGDSSTVRFVEIPFPAMPAALEAARVDAAWITEPYLTMAKKSGRVMAYGFDDIAKHFLITAWCATPQWAQAHPDLLTSFARVMHDTAIWANTHPDESATILVKQLKFTSGSVATLARVHFAESLTPALMQPVIDVSATYDGFSAFPAEQLIYTASAPNP
jgi:NitT/TauT family transport system substrate-binding protein